MQGHDARLENNPKTGIKIFTSRRFLRLFLRQAVQTKVRGFRRFSKSRAIIANHPFISAHLRFSERQQEAVANNFRHNKCGCGGDEQTLQQTYFPKEVQVAFKVLMTHVFCNSHDVSHFAAFFIVVGAKTSVAESVDLVISFLPESSHRSRGRARSNCGEFG